jgi:glutaredoxin
MRALVVAGLLLVLLGVGVIQASRTAEGGGLVSGWVQSQRPAARTNPASGGEAPAIVEPRAPAAPGPAPSAETDPPDEPSVLAAGELSVLEPEALPMVRYFDAEGSIRMVRGLSRVPAEHRASAVVVGRGNVNVVSIPAPSATAFRDWQPQANPNHARVVLFSASWCGACKRAKRYLDGRGISYLERDIDADSSARREVQRVLGRVAIPLLDVDGRFISGFRPETYHRALGSG